MDNISKILITVFGLFICTLLAGNLYMQIQILNRMAPTYGEMLKADRNVRKELMLKQPLIYIKEPLDVNVKNTPLEVENW